jgi:hypothetical protein
LPHSIKEIDDVLVGHDKSQKSSYR